jgi:membrane fusion protein, copper/silver efflux system
VNRNQLSLLAVVAATVLVVGGFYAGRRTASPESSVKTPSMTARGAATGDRRVLYWHDPMVPAQRFDKPGKSPFMDMQLVPVYADDASTTGVNVSPAVQQNLGLRTATVKRADASSSFDAVGTVQFDERLSSVVQTRVAGYVEQLAVRAPMEQVRKGQALATIFAPDWLAPQNELLALKRAGVSDDLIAAARQRMRAMSIPESLIRKSEETGTAQARFTLSAPDSGVIAELGVREGAAVTPGMTLFRIAGLEKVWAVAEVPEAQVAHLVKGQKVKAAPEADPTQTFEGELAELLPQVSSTTRTLQARFEVDNRSGKLTPGMLLRLRVAGPSSSRLVVPAEAVIHTGIRTVVIVRKDSGSFEPRNVQLGADLGDAVEVAQGLTEGEQVVASGQFLIDSEASLRSVTGRLTTPAQQAASATPASQAAPMVHVGQGKIESVGADVITISHGPIATLKWPAMTMGFGKPAPTSFADIHVGDTVRFEFQEGGPSGYQLANVQRLGGSK